MDRFKDLLSSIELKYIHIQCMKAAGECLPAFSRFPTIF